MENELKMKLKLKQNIGMSVHIAVVDKIKLLNRKIEIENEVKEIKLKMKLKLKQNIGISIYIEVIKTKQKYIVNWHECQYCSRQHSNKRKIK